MKRNLLASKIKERKAILFKSLSNRLRARLFLTVLLSVTFLGCGYKLRMVPLQSWPGYKATTLEQYAKEQKTPPGDTTMRMQYIAGLEDAYLKISKNGVATLSDLKERAEKRSVWIVASGGVGMGSGVTSSALLVASSANAVTAAILTGVASAVIALQSSSVLQGWSPEAIDRIYEPILKNMQDAEKNYQDKSATLLANVDASDSDWAKAANDAMMALDKYNSAMKYMPLAVGQSGDQQKTIDALTNALDTIKKLQPGQGENQPTAQPGAQR